MVKAILFDFGGVIYQHPVDVIPKVIAQIYDKPLNVIKGEYQKLNNDFYSGKLSSNQIIDSLTATFKSNKSRDRVRYLWIKYYSEMATPNQEILGLIRKLGNNYKLYLFSNTSELSNAYNRKTGIYDHFDDLFMSYQLGLLKPNPKIFNKVISLIGFKPQECILIDDNLKNVEAAKRLGIKTILFNVLIDNTAKLKTDLKKLKVII